MRKLPIEHICTRNKNYHLFKKDGGVSDCIREGGVWEEHLYNLIENISFKDTTIIDIGANLGAHTLEFADLVGDGGKVYSFEPQRVVFYQLCSNIFVNGYDNIYAFNKAVSNKNGVVHIEKQDFYFDGVLNIGNTHIQNQGDPVDGIKLDDYNLDNISLIKMDVQGFEPFVLDGATETIKRNRPLILIEIEDEHLTLYNKSITDIIYFFVGLSYEIKQIRNTDYIAYPKEKQYIFKDFNVTFSDKLYINCFLKNHENCKLYIRDYISKQIIYHEIINFEIGINWWFTFESSDKFIVEIFDKNNNELYKKIISK
jgi:FkbM family methyltransferase